MRSSTKGTRSSGAFHHFCLEVNADKHPDLSRYGHDFCEDFVRPPLGRSPQSLRALLATLDRHGACDGAIEGAQDAWRQFTDKGAMR